MPAVRFPPENIAIPVGGPHKRAQTSCFFLHFFLSLLEFSQTNYYHDKEKSDPKIVQFWFFETRNGDPTKAPLTSWYRS